MTKGHVPVSGAFKRARSRVNAPKSGLKRASSLQRHQMILDAAASVMAAQGYSETKLHEVGAACGMYAGSIYYYFDSREDLIRAVLAEALARMFRDMELAIQELPDTAGSFHRLRQLIAVLMQANVRRDNYAMAFARNIDQVPGSIVEDLSNARLQLRSRWNELIQEAKDANEIRAEVNITLARILILGTANWVSRWHKPDGEISSDEVVEQMTDMICNAFKVA